MDATISSVGIGPVSSPPNSGGSSTRRSVAAPADVGGEAALPLGRPDRVPVGLVTAHAGARDLPVELLVGGRGGLPGEAGRRRPPAGDDPLPQRAVLAGRATSGAGERLGVAHRAPSRQSSPSRRNSRSTGRSLATTGRPAAWASSTTRPKPSRSEGNAKTSAARNRAGMSVVGDRAEHGDVRVRRRAPGPRCTRRPRRAASLLPRVAVVGVVEQRLAAGDGQQRPRARCARGPARRPPAACGCPCAARCRRRPAPSGARPSPWRARPRPGRAGSPAKRAPSTPLGITVGRDAVVARRARRPSSRLTQTRWSTSSIDARWHSASTGLAKSLTWWIVLHHRRHHALGAQRQQRPRRQAVLGVVDVGRAGGAHAVGQRRRVAQDARLHVLARAPVDRHQAHAARAARGRSRRRRPTAPTARRRGRASPSASARLSACTTPPRGLVE